MFPLEVAIMFGCEIPDPEGAPVTHPQESNIKREMVFNIIFEVFLVKYEMCQLNRSLILGLYIQWDWDSLGVSVKQNSSLGVDT